MLSFIHTGTAHEPRAALSCRTLTAAERMLAFCQSGLTDRRLSTKVDSMSETSATEDDPVKVEVTLTIDGDWNSDPLRLLSGLGHGSRSLERWQQKAVAAAREQGMTWDAIGAACGISRQAAWQRFAADAGPDGSSS